MKLDFFEAMRFTSKYFCRVEADMQIIYVDPAGNRFQISLPPSVMLIIEKMYDRNKQEIDEKGFNLEIVKTGEGVNTMYEVKPFFTHEKKKTSNFRPKKHPLLNWLIEDSNGIFSIEPTGPDYARGCTEKDI